jgi:integrase
MVLFALNTGAREANICGLRWAWEQPIPEVGRSVFVVPASEFKSKRPLVIILNDVAWRIVEEQRGKHKEFVFVYRRERVKHLDKEPAMKYHPVGKINNTAFQRARDLAGVPVREHDLRHTFGHRLREAKVPKEDRALLMGHTVEGDMTQLYADASIANLIEQANRVQETRDRMTLLRVVNG